MNFLVDVGDRLAEGVAEENHAPDPEKPAADVVDQVARIAHSRGPGDRRAERADDGHEAGENDGLASVLFVKLVGTFEMASFEKARILALVEGLAGAASDPVAELVTGDRAKGDKAKKLGEVQGAGSGKDSGCDQQRIARQEKADEHPRFDKDDRADKQRPAPFNQAADVVQTGEDVFQMLEHGLR